MFGILAMQATVATINQRWFGLKKDEPQLVSQTNINADETGFGIKAPPDLTRSSHVYLCRRC